MNIIEPIIKTMVGIKCTKKALAAVKAGVEPSEQLYAKIAEEAVNETESFFYDMQKKYNIG